MGRIVSEKPGETTPRHPSPRATIPGSAIYLDAKDKDLPYNGYFKQRLHRGPESSYFDQPLGLREEGAMLLAILTGVHGSPLQKLAPGMPGFSLLYGVGREGARDSPRHAKGTTPSQALKLDLRLDVAAGLGANAAMMKKQQQKLQKNIEPVDECVDTMDLQELTAEKEPEGKNWLYETAEEEELYKLTQNLDANAESGKEISLKDYIAMVKKSAGRLGMRTQMLQDLCLAEDVDLGVTDLPAAPPPPPPKPGATGANPEKSDDSAKPKLGKDQYIGAMSATSLVVKKARRLAGLMHTEQQTLDLRDVWDWLQHLGTIAPPESRPVDATKADGTSQGKGNSDDQKQGDWRLPSSPAMALLYAQEDLRQRLAHLYQEKNTLENRKLHLTAAKKLVGKVGDAEEAKLQNYIHGLQSLEEGYETLGGKIADNLDDAQNLDKRFQTLTEEARVSNKAKDGKDSKKGKKKGKKGKKGKRKKEEAAGEGEEKSDASGAHDVEPEGKTESEGSDGERNGGKLKKSKKKGQSATEVSAPATEHKATSPIISLREPGIPSSTVDQACQTDDAALFSLMEKMFNDMEEEGPTGPEDEGTELRRLRREVKKMKMQLRFWRSRNWIERHQHLLSSTSTKDSFKLPVDASPSEAGFAFYFDSARMTIPSSDVLRGGHGSAPSNLTSYGMGSAHAKVAAYGVGGPSSAPSTLQWPTRPVHPTPSPTVTVNNPARTSMSPPPAGLRLSQVENQRPGNPLNLRMMVNSPPRGSRPSRGWSIRPQELHPAFPPNSLVIFGRSSQLLTPRESTPYAQTVPQIGNMTPRRSGMQHQKA